MDTNTEKKTEQAIEPETTERSSETATVAGEPAASSSEVEPVTVPAEPATRGTAQVASDTSTGESNGNEISKRVAELEAEVAELKDKHLRALAEIENTSKRAERMRTEGEQFATRGFGNSLLHIYDAFDRLNALMDDGFRTNSPQFAGGVDLVQKLLLEVFAGYKIEVINPAKGDVFNPHFHESMFKEIDEGAAAGTIVRVVTKGFRMGEQLLRAAQVSVADDPPKASKEAPPAVAEDDGGPGLDEATAAPAVANGDG